MVEQKVDLNNKLDLEGFVESLPEDAKILAFEMREHGFLVTVDKAGEAMVHQNKKHRRICILIDLEKGDE